MHCVCSVKSLCTMQIKFTSKCYAKADCGWYFQKIHAHCNMRQKSIYLKTKKMYKTYLQKTMLCC